MAIRVSKLLRETNIGLSTLHEILKALNYSETDISLKTKLPDEIANIVREFSFHDIDLLSLIEKSARKDSYSETKSSLKIIGRIDLDEYNMPHNGSNIIIKERIKNAIESGAQTPPLYDESNNSFWIEELIVLSSQGIAKRIKIGAYEQSLGLPLYSVLIGSNGVGKSTLMKEIVDFFIDLRLYAFESESKRINLSKGRLKGVKYHIDGCLCEVIRMENAFLAKIEGSIQPLMNLRFPSIVACHFGAFDKFPNQKVNGSVQTRYDVPYYKYVGAHINGSMISSSAISFRLLFSLSENMNDLQQQNIKSILDYIGYYHKITLKYSFVLRTKKEGEVRNLIIQRVQKDREYINFSNTQRNSKAKELYDFYKKKTSSNKQYCYEIDLDSSSYSTGSELNLIYKLKQYELISSTNVAFYKHGYEIASEDMSSGEFAMLSTVLSISAAAADDHTLVLLDEPELSLHPNWQMTLIDNLDRALKNQKCQLVIATHSHMLVSDLPMNRSSVIQLEKNKEGDIVANPVYGNTYGWSAEEVLLKVFKTTTDRNRYFGERIGKLLEQMGNNTISKGDVAIELEELQEISMHLSDVDPMKMVLNTIVEAYR